MQQEEQNTGLTPEKIDQLAGKFYDKVMEKMDEPWFETDMVHEDIRIMHHLVKLTTECSMKALEKDVSSALSSEQFEKFIRQYNRQHQDRIKFGKNESQLYDSTFLVMPDDEEHSMIITPKLTDATLKLNVEEAEVLAKIIHDQIQLWK